MNFRIVQTIFRKEMRDTLRDRRTLVAMIAVPVVLYPALLLVTSQTALMHKNRVEAKASRVVLDAPEPGPLVDWLEEMDQVVVVYHEDPKAALLNGEVQAILSVPGDVEARLAANETAHLTIQYDATEAESREAVERLRESFERHKAGLLHARLEALGLPDAYAEPIKIGSKNIAPPEKTAGTLIGTVLPLLMITMVGVGALYPAIDLTAGEKERGTFETLLSTPTAKFDMVCGKFITVFLLAILAGMLNLGSMLLTFAFLMGQISTESAPIQMDISARMIGAIAIVLVPLAFLISAVMMAVSVLARSFREAQNFVTPVFVLILFPAGVAALPGTKLTAVTQVIPITNVSLLFKELMTGGGSLDSAFIVFISTAVYALLALVVAGWMFQREEILLSEEKGIPLSLRRAHFTPRPVPTPGMALFLFAFCVLLLFYVGTYAQTWAIYPGIFITQYALFLVPTVFILWFTKIDLRAALSLRIPAPGAVAGTVLLTAGWLVLIIQLSYWQNLFMPVPDEMKQAMEKLLDTETQGVSLLVVFLAIAVSPAICEEVLFRGGILSGLRSRMPVWACVVVVGLLFGAMHLSVYRVVLTGLSGMVLTYVVLRGRSIYLGMLGHFIVNGSAVLLVSGLLPGLAERVEPMETQGVPPLWLSAAFAVFATGIAIVEWSARRRPAPDAATAD